MSAFAHIEGWIEYPDDGALADAIDRLEDSEHLDGDAIVTASGRRIGRCVDWDDCRIVIPFAEYHDATEIVREELFTDAIDAHVACAGIDGGLVGRVRNKHGVTNEVDLEDWGEKRGHGERPDSDEAFTDALEWATTVIQDYVRSNGRLHYRTEVCAIELEEIEE